MEAVIVCEGVRVWEPLSELVEVPLVVSVSLGELLCDGDCDGVIDCVCDGLVDKLGVWVELLL